MLDLLIARWADVILDSYFGTSAAGTSRATDGERRAGGPCAIEPLESERGFRLSGAVDVHSGDALREALEPELHGTLVLDLIAVDFIDDSGLGTILGAYRRLRERGGSLVLRSPRGQVMRMLELTGVAEVPGLIAPTTMVAGGTIAASDGGTIAVSPRARPSYTLSLLIRLDERTGRLAPSVQIRGHGNLTEPWVRLELVDLEGTLRHVVRKRLPPAALGTEFALPAFDPPAGANPEWALGWHWDVVIEDEGGELARWREHPRSAGVLNAEAELAGTPERVPKADGRWYWIDGPVRYAPGGECEIHCRECAHSMWVTPARGVEENFPPPESCPRCAYGGGRWG